MDEKMNVNNDDKQNQAAQKPINDMPKVQGRLADTLKGLIKKKPTPEEQTYYETKMLFHSRLRTWCTAVIALVFLAVGIFVMSIGTHATRILNEAEGAFSKLNTIAADFENVDFPVMFDEINTLIEEGQTMTVNASASMEKALGKVEALEIETLNQSIEDFSAVVEALSRFFGR